MNADDKQVVIAFTEAQAQKMRGLCYEALAREEDPVQRDFLDVLVDQIEQSVEEIAK